MEKELSEGVKDGFPIGRRIHGVVNDENHMSLGVDYDKMNDE